MRTVLFGLMMVAASATLAAQAPNVKATLTPIAASTAVAAGGTIDLAVRVSLPAGLHAQSNKPKDDSLIPTTLTFAPSDVIVPSEVVFPPAHDFKLDTGDTLLVFEKDFTIGIRAKAGASAVGAVTLEARLRYQPCDNLMCYRPVTVPVRWTIPVGAGGTPMLADEFKSIRFGSGEPATITKTPFVAETRATAEAVALPPSLETFEVRGAAGGYMNVDAFLKFVSDAEAGITAKGMFADKGPLAILLLVFVGGLALNLTPCVLPMVPINLAIIGAGAASGRAGAGAASGRAGAGAAAAKSRGFFLGLMYGLAMAVVYGVLGLVVILTAGTFGTINASPWFNAGIAVLFIVLGLAMFDIGAIDFSKFSSKIRFDGAKRGSPMLAFAMGSVAALLAGACVAPVVIQVVVFASDQYAKGQPMALALPFVLGLGMALPWPVAGAGLSKLPKPGAWMNKVKYAFGVFIIAMAGYYGYLTYEIVANRWVDKADVEASTAEKAREGWFTSLDDGLRAAQASGQPVLVDMWATWCKSCLTMDKTTLADARVKTTLDGYVKIKFQAEDPEAPGTKEVMQKFGAVGLPAYGVLRAK